MKHKLNTLYLFLAFSILSQVICAQENTVATTEKILAKLDKKLMDENTLVFSNNRKRIAFKISYQKKRAGN